MAVKRKAPAKTTEKLTVAKRLEPIFLDTVTIKQNSNGNDYVATPAGAVYARLDEIQPGLHTPVELSNGAIALNRPTRQEVMNFLSAQKAETGWSISELREFYGL